MTVDGVTVSAPSASITGNSTDGYPVSGTTTPNAAIEILNEAGDVVGSTTADDTGAYTVTLDPADVAPEEALQVVAVVTAGGQDYRSNATPITVPADIEQTGTPTIDPVTAGDTTISGTAEPGSTVTVTITDQEPVTAETDDEGNWLAEVPAVWWRYSYGRCRSRRQRAKRANQRWSRRSDRSSTDSDRQRQ